MEAKLRPLLKEAVESKKIPAIGAFLVDSKGDFLLKETFGTTNIDDASAPPFDADTAVQLHSCSKLVTSIAALQLLEQGKLSLSDPVEKYVPRISEIQVLESITDNDNDNDTINTNDNITAAEPESKFKFKFRAPKTKPTIHHLLTHTAGFSYDFFDKPTLQWRQTTSHPPGHYNDVGRLAAFESPFLADPGTKYIYGVNTDWLGFVIQEITGTTLPEYVEQNILMPLGMRDTHPRPVEGQKRLVIHVNVDGKLTARPELLPTATPEVWGGGAFLFSTMNDFAKLMSALLNGGTGPHTGNSILKPETVKKYLFTDHLSSMDGDGDVNVDKSLLGEIGSSIPSMSSEGSFFPSLPISSRGWSCGLLLNLEDLPRGRKSGSGAWAGLANLYYWIDPAAGLAGMVCSAVLPFFDPTVVKLFDQLERVAYGHDLAGMEDDDGLGNNSVGSLELRRRQQQQRQR